MPWNLGTVTVSSKSLQGKEEQNMLNLGDTSVGKALAVIEGAYAGLHNPQNENSILPSNPEVITTDGGNEPQPEIDIDMELA